MLFSCTMKSKWSRHDALVYDPEGDALQDKCRVCSPSLFFSENIANPRWPTSS